MNRTCTRAHDGKYPEEAVVAFCTQVDCNKRFVCGRCYHDYHSDHLIQIVPIKELQAHINKANGQTQESQKLMDQLQVIKKQLIQTIESLCTDLQKQDINHGNNITEEMLDQILQKNKNSETRLKKVKEVLSDFQNIDNALKQDIRIQRQVSIVKDRVFNGATYSGEVVDDMRHGIGTAVYNEGSYHGQWNKGVRCGQGIFKWTDGDQYEGEYEEDKRHGRGVYKWANGNSYDGDWLNDKRTGSGKFIYQNGNIQLGKWSESQQQGDHEFYELKKTSIITYKDGKEIKRQQI